MPRPTTGPDPRAAATATGTATIPTGGTDGRAGTGTARMGVPAGTVLTREEWSDRERRHVRRVDALLAGHRERAARGRTHPVEDFLFTYYSHRPGQLARWHPGPGVLLEDAPELVDRPWTAAVARPGRLPAVQLDAAAFAARRRPLLEFLRRYLTATASAAPAYGCFGLHEWAMVYRDGGPPDPAHTAAGVPDDPDARGVPATGPDTAASPGDRTPAGAGPMGGGPMGGRRHARFPLRLGAAGTDAVVDAATLRCTHFDAFRFFTPEARPLNSEQPTRPTAAELDQPGCLHVGMDLYKWAYKLAPAVPAELVVDCFVLARDIRELDMRASPYDLTTLGLAPVPVETAAGRSAYAAAQRAFTARGRPLRQQLRAVVGDLLTAAPPQDPSA